MGTYVASLSDATPKLIISALEPAYYGPTGYLLFVREGTLLAQRFDLKRLEIIGEPQFLAEHVRSTAAIFQEDFSTSDSGDLVYGSGTTYRGGWNLTWFDEKGKALNDVLENEIIIGPTISPDGRHVAVQLNDPANGNGDIWVIDLLRGTRTRLTFDPALDQMPVWSPDGQRVAFRSLRKAAGHIFEKRADGTGEEQPLFPGDSSDQPLSWSPDSKFLAFRRTEGPAWNIWVWPKFGDRKPYPFLLDSFNKDMARFSPNGKWLAYQSDESGAPEVYVVPFPNAPGRWQVSRGGGRQPVWGKDGSELFFLDANNTIVSVIARESGASLELEDAHPAITIPVSVTSGRLYDVSRDRKQFLAIQIIDTTTEEPLVLVENWPAELKK